MPSWPSGEIIQAFSGQGWVLPSLRPWGANSAFGRPQIQHGQLSVRLWRNTEYFQANYIVTMLAGLCIDAYHDPRWCCTIMVSMALVIGLWTSLPTHARPGVLRATAGHVSTVSRRTVQLLAVAIGPVTAKGSSKAEPAAYAAAVALLVALLVVVVGGVQLSLRWLAFGSLLGLGHAVLNVPKPTSSNDPAGFPPKKAVISMKGQTTLFAWLWQPYTRRIL